MANSGALTSYSNAKTIAQRRQLATTNSARSTSTTTTEWQISDKEKQDLSDAAQCAFLVPEFWDSDIWSQAISGKVSSADELTYIMDKLYEFCPELRPDTTSVILTTRQPTSNKHAPSDTSVAPLTSMEAETKAVRTSHAVVSGLTLDVAKHRTTKGTAADTTVATPGLTEGAPVTSLEGSSIEVQPASNAATTGTAQARTRVAGTNTPSGEPTEQPRISDSETTAGVQGTHASIEGGAATTSGAASSTVASASTKTPRTSQARTAGPAFSNTNERTRAGTADGTTLASASATAGATKARTTVAAASSTVGKSSPELTEVAPVTSLEGSSTEAQSVSYAATTVDAEASTTVAETTAEAQWTYAFTEGGIATTSGAVPSTVAGALVTLPSDEAMVTDAPWLSSSQATSTVIGDGNVNVPIDTGSGTTTEAEGLQLPSDGVGFDPLNAGQALAQTAEQDSILENDDVMAAIYSAVAVVVVAGFIILAVVLRRRNKKKKSQQVHSASHTQAPTITSANKRPPEKRPAERKKSDGNSASKVAVPQRLGPLRRLRVNTEAKRRTSEKPRLERIQEKINPILSGIKRGIGLTANEGRHKDLADIYQAASELFKKNPSQGVAAYQVLLRNISDLINRSSTKDDEKYYKENRAKVMDLLDNIISADKSVFSNDTVRDLVIEKAIKAKQGLMHDQLALFNIQETIDTVIKDIDATNEDQLKPSAYFETVRRHAFKDAVDEGKVLNIVEDAWVQRFNQQVDESTEGEKDALKSRFTACLNEDGDDENTVVQVLESEWVKKQHRIAKEVANRDWKGQQSEWVKQSIQRVEDDMAAASTRRRRVRDRLDLGDFRRRVINTFKSVVQEDSDSKKQFRELYSEWMKKNSSATGDAEDEIWDSLASNWASKMGRKAIMRTRSRRVSEGVSPNSSPTMSIGDYWQQSKKQFERAISSAADTESQEELMLNEIESYWEKKAKPSEKGKPGSKAKTRKPTDIKSEWMKKVIQSVEDKVRAEVASESKARTSPDFGAFKRKVLETVKNVVDEDVEADKSLGELGLDWKRRVGETVNKSTRRQRVSGKMSPEHKTERQIHGQWRHIKQKLQEFEVEEKARDAEVTDEVQEVIEKESKQFRDVISQWVNKIIRSVDADDSDADWSSFKHRIKGSIESIVRDDVQAKTAVRDIHSEWVKRSKSGQSGGGGGKGGGSTRMDSDVDSQWTRIRRETESGRTTEAETDDVWPDFEKRVHQFADNSKEQADAVWVNVERQVRQLQDKTGAFDAGVWRRVQGYLNQAKSEVSASEKHSEDVCWKKIKHVFSESVMGEKSSASKRKKKDDDWGWTKLKHEVDDYVQVKHAKQRREWAKVARQIESLFVKQKTADKKVLGEWQPVLRQIEEECDAAEKEGLEKDLDWLWAKVKRDIETVEERVAQKKANGEDVKKDLLWGFKTIRRSFEDIQQREDDRHQSSVSSLKRSIPKEGSADVGFEWQRVSRSLQVCITEDAKRKNHSDLVWGWQKVKHHLEDCKELKSIAAPESSQEAKVADDDDANWADKMQGPLGGGGKKSLAPIRKKSASMKRVIREAQDPNWAKAVSGPRRKGVEEAKIEKPDEDSALAHLSPEKLREIELKELKWRQNAERLRGKKANDMTLNDLDKSPVQKGRFAAPTVV